MKIAMIVPSLANKGPIIVAKDLCEQYTQMGHSCKVYYFDNIVDLDMPCDVERINFGESISFNEWNIVHTHGLRPDCYVRLHKPMIKKTCTRFITTLHNPISIKAALYGRNLVSSIFISVLWHLALTAFDKIIYLNEHTRKYTKLLISKDDEVIHNGRNILTNTNDLNDNIIQELKDQYYIIGTISNIERRKGIEQLLYALCSLTQCALCIVGDGPELMRLKILAKELNVIDRCYWAGYNPLAHKYHKYFDVFAMCSRSEGFPLALIESAAYGTPTVLSDIPILKSIIHEPIVEFYQLDNIDNLVEKINKILKVPHLYSISIKTYYKAHMTAYKMAENYINAYESI